MLGLNHEVISRAADGSVIKYFSGDVVRFHRECEFYRKLDSRGLPIPRLIERDDKELKIRIEHLNGSNPTDLKLYSRESLKFLTTIREIDCEGYPYVASEGADCVASLGKVISLLINDISTFINSGTLEKLIGYRQLNAISRDINEILMTTKDFGFPTNPVFCLSPSDFGIHNTIETAGGMKFFDFEHAGVDCFQLNLSKWFHQPRVDISRVAYREFCRTLGTPNSAEIVFWSSLGKLFWLRVIIRRIIHLDCVFSRSSIIDYSQRYFNG